MLLQKAFSIMKQMILKKSRFSTSFLHVEFLYGEYKIKKKLQRTSMHSHPFWQLEVITDGTSRINFEQDSFLAKAGNVLIVPPGAMHHFIYQDIGCSYLSIKFNIHLREKHAINDLRPQLINKPEIHRCYCTIMDSLERCNDEKETAGFISGIEHTTASLMEQVFFLKTQKTVDPIVAQLRWLINNQPQKPLSVDVAVKLLKMNKKYVAERIHKEAGITIKEFIDHERAEIAAQSLIHSSQNISEIAYLLGFRDQYTFSRFFKRAKGISPKAFRVESKG
jgi:AraC-like DNA-binding protein/mannose-6-phosphate isomerase-like protein (cupin superfamily)